MQNYIRRTEQKKKLNLEFLPSLMHYSMCDNAYIHVSQPGNGGWKVIATEIFITLYDFLVN